MHDDCSKSVITVKIDDIKKGSAGIMMRSTDSQSSANVHLEATATGDLFVFFRQQEGGSTSYRRVGYIGFPVEIRLTRQGNSFLSHYKMPLMSGLKALLFLSILEKRICPVFMPAPEMTIK